MQRPRLRDLLPVTVRVHDPEEVTAKSHRETDPRGVGLTTQDVEAIWDAVVRFRIYKDHVADLAYMPVWYHTGG